MMKGTGDGAHDLFFVRPSVNSCVRDHVSAVFFMIVVINVFSCVVK